jgi:geranylgeranylglycerol-phosphate geranylgeranyltransferase
LQGERNGKLTFKQVLCLLNSKKQPLGYATAGGVAYMIASVTANSFSLSLNILVLAMLYTMYSAIYLYNDIVDREIDKINARERSIASDRTTPKQARKIVIFLFVIVAFLVLLAIYFCHARGWQDYLIILVTVLTSLLLGIIYSHPRIYLKKRFPLKSISIAAGAGLSSMIGWAMSSTNFSLFELLSILSTSALIFVMSILLDLRDIKGDRLYNVKTFPIVLGVNMSCKIMCYNLLIPMITAMVIAVLFGEHIGPITMGILALVSIVGIKVVLQLRNNLDDGKAFLDGLITVRRLYYLTQLGMGSLVIGNLTFH